AGALRGAAGRAQQLRPAVRGPASGDRPALGQPAPDVLDGRHREFGDAPVDIMGGRPVARLVVVSNRVAAPDEHGKQAPGGLAVAVAAAMHEREGIWFGWSGGVSDDPPEPTTTEIDRVRYVLTDLHSSEFDEYYNGFAN